MTKTFGQILLDDAIPEKYRSTGVYSKKELKTNMMRLAHDDPEQYVKTITNVKRLGDEFATLEGISIGLDDIEPEYAKRNAIVKPALAQVKKAKTLAEKQKIILATQDKMLDYAMEHKGTMGDMARAGARGTAVQLMRGVGAPTASSDEQGGIQPWLTTHSYAEGLRPSEWWATSREARMAGVATYVSVTEPGDLSKILVNNTSDQTITKDDCGTHNGLPFNADDADIMDRFTAHAAGSIPYNTLVNAPVLSKFKKEGTKKVIVRSPMTCDVDRGVCQKCMGLNSTGALNKIGENVGVRASQAMGEPLTQFALNAKHGVRLSGGGAKGVSGLSGFRAIMETPESFKNKATLTTENGNVTNIAKAPQGGYYVTVNATKFHIAQGLDPVVKVGDQVNRGDVLSEGTPRPAEVVELKGLGAGRAYVVDKLAGIYKDSGHNLDRRHFEVLAKSTLNHMKIEDIDDESSAATGLVRGDIIDYNRYKNIMGNEKVKIPLAEAEGRYLGEGFLEHMAGTKITKPMLDEFRAVGFPKVVVSTKAPTVSPIMAPATRNPLLNPDWLVRLGHRYLKDSLREGAHEAQTSNLHGSHPLPAMIFGADFGEGIDGRY